MKKNSSLLILVLGIALLSSCGTSKNVAYFQNSDNVSLAASEYLFDAKIMPKDVLNITVSSSNDDAAAPFNLTIPTPYTLGARSSYSQAMLQSYIVDNEGDIDFPIVGKLHLAGLTKNDAEQLIHDKIRPYMAETENPIVTVRMINYKISVIGEVALFCEHWEFLRLVAFVKFIGRADHIS